MRRQTLSFCVATRSPASRVHALLALMRDHVDEIVLSVDARGDLDALDACADLADRRFLHELDRNPNWLAAWLQHECSGDWILRLDDDEVPSVALLDALPELIADRYPTVYRIPRRWLVAPDRYATGFPWQLEGLGRLLRNQPGVWHMNGALHTEGFWEGEARYVEAPMYHLDTVLSSAEERRAKVERYRGHGGGMVIEGVDVNRFYLPEEWEGLITAPVPAADLPAIESLLDPVDPPPSTGSGGPVERVDQATAGRRNRLVGSAAPPAAGELRVLTERGALPARARRHLEVEVENTGEAPWWRMLFWETPSVAIVWRWLDRNGGEIAPPGASALPGTVFPGTRARAWIVLETPAMEGPCELELQLAAGAIDRFGRPLTLAIEIEPPERALEDTLDPLTRRERDLAARESAAAARERAVAAFTRTRRYRFAASLGKSLDRLRAGLRGPGHG